MIPTSWKPRGIQLAADRADAAVHHVGRGDQVGAGLGVGEGGVGEEAEGGVVVNATRGIEHAAVAVGGVGAEANVGDDD